MGITKLLSLLPSLFLLDASRRTTLKPMATGRATVKANATDVSQEQGLRLSVGRAEALSARELTDP